MKYKILSSKYNFDFLVSESSKWHYSRGKDLSPTIKKLIKKLKYHKSWRKTFTIGYKTEAQLRLNTWQSYLNYTNTKSIIIYKPKANKKGIRVIYDTRANARYSKNYKLCYNVEQIVNAITKFTDLHLLFG